DRAPAGGDAPVPWTDAPLAAEPLGVVPGPAPLLVGPVPAGPFGVSPVRVAPVPFGVAPFGGWKALHPGLVWGRGARPSKPPSGRNQWPSVRVPDDGGASRGSAFGGAGSSTRVGPARLDQMSGGSAVAKT